ncbi:hypothetical protein HCZ87_03735 [Phaeobacter sp. HF9A]|nr:hypothetical protein [Phaeobacter sp. HF9A]
MANVIVTNVTVAISTAITAVSLSVSFDVQGTLEMNVDTKPAETCGKQSCDFLLRRGQLPLGPGHGVWTRSGRRQSHAVFGLPRHITQRSVGRILPHKKSNRYS